MSLKLVRRPSREAWYVRGELAGVSIYRTTGTSDREIAEAIRVKAEQRILREVAYGKRAVVLFDDAALSYDRSGAPMRFIFDIRKSDGAERGLAPYFRGRRLVDITQSDLVDAGRALYPNVTRETLVRQVYTPFVAVWNHAVRKQWAEPRIWERPRKAKGTLARLMVRRSGASPVTYERAAIFVAAMSPAPAMLMTALFYTGMRPIEILTLRGGDIDVAKRWITLLSTKSDEPRGVPIHDFLAPLFESLLHREALASDACIFRTPRGEPYEIVRHGGGGLKSAIDGARRRSGITDISPYTARHTVSTQLVVNGVHLHVKDQILGHTRDSMSRRYTHVPQQPLIDAINTLPVPEAWRAAPWWQDPLAWSGRLVDGTGRRNDLRRP